MWNHSSEWHGRTYDGAEGKVGLSGSIAGNSLGLVGPLVGLGVIRVGTGL